MPRPQVLLEPLGELVCRLLGHVEADHDLLVPAEGMRELLHAWRDCRVRPQESRDLSDAATRRLIAWSRLCPTFLARGVAARGWW